MRANGVAWGSFKGVTGNGAGEQSSPRKPFPMSEMVTRGTRDTSTSSGSRPCHWKRGKDRVTKAVEVLSCHRGEVSRWDCAGLLVTTGGDLSIRWLVPRCGDLSLFSYSSNNRFITLIALLPLC